MKIERRKTRVTEVYTASLNDIMFFLLLFFLIISTMVTPAAIRVLLPKASTSEKVIMRKTVNLAITSDLRYYIENKEITKDQIEPMLADILSKKLENEEMNVSLQADKSLAIQDFVDIVDIGNRLKVQTVLVTQKP